TSHLNSLMAINILIQFVLLSCVGSNLISIIEILPKDDRMNVHLSINTPFDQIKSVQYNHVNDKLLVIGNNGYTWLNNKNEQYELYSSDSTYISSTIDQIQNITYVLRRLNDYQISVDIIHNDNHDMNTSLLLLANKNYTNIRIDSIHKVIYAISDDDDDVTSIDVYSLIDNYFLKTLIHCGMNHLKQLEIMYLEMTTLLVMNDGKKICIYNPQNHTNPCVTKTNLNRNIQIVHFTISNDIIYALLRQNSRYFVYEILINKVGQSKIKYRIDKDQIPGFIYTKQISRP
ncbi:unnamed protein product, partial [Didymodactylos carnosus]